MNFHIQSPPKVLEYIFFYFCCTLFSVLAYNYIWQTLASKVTYKRALKSLSMNTLTLVQIGLRIPRSITSARVAEWNKIPA